jgi:hypothetical protein
MKLWTIFSNETYRGCESNQDLQNYCRNNFKCYGFQKTDEKIYYCLGRPYINLFKILHITTKGEFTFPIEVYMDTIDDFIQICEKYSLKDKITINHSYGCILSHPML